VSADPAYSGYDVPEVNGVNADNDQAQIITTPLASAFSEYGGKGQYNLRLGSPPAGSVTINMRSGRPDRAVLQPASVTLTTANWQAGAGFMLVPTDDQLRDGDAAFTVTFDPAVATQDPAYAGRVASPVPATVLDDERVIFTSKNAHPGDMDGQSPDDVCARQDPGDGSLVLFHPPKAFLVGRTSGGTINRVASNTAYQGDGQQDWVLRAGLQYLSDDRDGAVIARANQNNLLPIEPPQSLSGPISQQTIWTGLLPDWTSGEDCTGWTSAYGIDLGRSGKGGGLDSVGISYNANQCTTPQNIACVEQ